MVPRVSSPTSWVWEPLRRLSSKGISSPRILWWEENVTLLAAGLIFSPLRDRLAFVKTKRCFDEPAYRKERSESSSGEGWKETEEGRENWERLKGRGKIADYERGEEGRGQGEGKEACKGNMEEGGRVWNFFQKPRRSQVLHLDWKGGKSKKAYTGIRGRK